MADFYKSHVKQKLLKRLNTFSLLLGILGSLGVSIVANFQETSVVVVHFLGASLCFGLGALYLWIQVAKIFFRDFSLRHFLKQTCICICYSAGLYLSLLGISFLSQAYLGIEVVFSYCEHLFISYKFCGLFSG